MKSLMNKIPCTSATKMMMWHFMDAPEKFATEDHKKLFHRMAMADEFCLMDLLSLMDYINRHPVTGNYDYSNLGGAGPDFIIGQLEVMFQTTAMTESMHYYDVLVGFAENRATSYQELVDYLATNPILPSPTEIRAQSDKVTRDTKKIILDKIAKLDPSLVNQFGLDDIADKYLDDVGGQEGSDLSDWGSAEGMKRKLH
jgi:hypothetical protein